MANKNSHGYTNGPCPHLSKIIKVLQKEEIRILVENMSSGALICNSCMRFIYLYTDEKRESENRDLETGTLLDAMYTKDSIGN